MIISFYIPIQLIFSIYIYIFYPHLQFQLLRIKVYSYHELYEYQTKITCEPVEIEIGFDKGIVLLYICIYILLFYFLSSRDVLFSTLGFFLTLSKRTTLLVLSVQLFDKCDHY